MAAPPTQFYSNLLDVSGKSALVTGATAGIGEQIAIRFGELGLKTLYIAGRRSDRLDALKAKIQPYMKGGEVVPVVCDVSNKEACEKMKAATGPVDFLINNAGLALGVAEAAETTYDDLVTMMNTNVIAVGHLTSLYVPDMKKQKFGHIINISSIAGSEAYIGGSVYCATKSAVSTYTRALRMELAKTPVRVTTISPGLCETEFSMVRLKDETKAKNVYGDVVALDPADVADNVVYALTRPAHVQICDIEVFCTNQGAVRQIERVGPSLGG